MLDVRFRPLPQWTEKPTTNRRSLPGDQTYTKILDRLETELTQLKAADIVIETGHRAEDIRNDGWIRSNARVPAHPGVVLWFDAKAVRGGKQLGPMRYALDRYETWQDNLRALVLTLEALRAVDRYGATTHGEQYRGYAALPAYSAHDTKWEAARTLLKTAGYRFDDGAIRDFFADAEVRKDVCRTALKGAHPDSPGGSDSAFITVRAAYESLGVKV